jgi:hypothetical protein
MTVLCKLPVPKQKSLGHSFVELCFEHAESVVFEPSVVKSINACPLQVCEEVQLFNTPTHLYSDFSDDDLAQHYREHDLLSVHPYILLETLIYHRQSLALIQSISTHWKAADGTWAGFAEFSFHTPGQLTVTLGKTRGDYNKLGVFAGS